ncbi:hypothetical protein VPH35_011850 [Triticum aestivum]
MCFDVGRPATHGDARHGELEVLLRMENLGRRCWNRPVGDYAGIGRASPHEAFFFWNQRLFLLELALIIAAIGTSVFLYCFYFAGTSIFFCSNWLICLLQSIIRVFCR